jgi:hypothetical protein
MEVKAFKCYFLYTNSNIVPIPKEFYKIHVKKAYFFAGQKKTK